ncbi:MAG TPA: prepilin peptidase [Chloroflexota bacterium]|nr:prepilin peptidase [Chloroflexota bacterium]
MMNNLLTAMFVVAAAWATYTDLKHRRIANWLTFGAAGAALAARLVMGGPPALLDGVEGWLAGVGILLIPFVLGWMGAGDVKLLGAFGALGGVDFVVQSALYGCILGGILAVAFLIREKKLWFVLSNLFIYIRHPLGSVLEAKRRMPFGPALAAGAALSMVIARGAA